jgi:hypothetical protein
MITPSAQYCTRGHSDSNKTPTMGSSPSVKKKFQWTPYSETCSCPQITYLRMRVGKEPRDATYGIVDTFDKDCPQKT